MAEVVGGTEQLCCSEEHLKALGSCLFPTKTGQLVDMVNGCNMNQGKHVNELNSTYFGCLPVGSPEELKWTLPPQALNTNAYKNAQGATFLYGFNHALR